MSASAVKSRKPAEITSACINRVTVKATGEVFYLVASDSHPGEYHTVVWDESRACYTCSCVARKPCKHIHAVESVQQAKRELAAEQAARDKKVSDFFMMQQYGLQLNNAGKMYHFIPAEKLPIPERKCARQYEDWSSPDVPIYASAGQHHDTRLGAREGFSLLK